jgi:hypothetical protein
MQCDQAQQAATTWCVVTPQGGLGLLHALLAALYLVSGIYMHIALARKQSRELWPTSSRGSGCASGRSSRQLQGSDEWCKLLLRSNTLYMVNSTPLAYMLGKACSKPGIKAILPRKDLSGTARYTPWP